MTNERLDDPVWLAVRAARPARPIADDSPSSPPAQAVLERALASHPPPARRRRSQSTEWTGWAVPVAGVLVALAVVVVALGALAGRQRPQTGPAGSGSAMGLSSAQYVFAVGGDTSAETSREQGSSGLVLFRAEQVLRARCMRERGLRYIADPTPQPSSLPSVTGYPSTFYPQPSVSAYPEATLLALRQRVGFGIHAGSITHRRDPDPDDRYLSTLKPGQQQLWRQAFNGRAGCYGVAEAQLYGSRRAANMELLVPSEIYDYLNTVAYTRAGAISRSDSRTAAAAAAWSRCMRRTTGQPWSDENALITGLYSKHTPTQLGSRSFAQLEVRLAVADTRCAYSTGQARTFAAVFRQAASHLPASTQVQLRYLLSHRARWISRAKRILATAQP